MEPRIHPQASLMAAQEDDVLVRRLPIDRYVKSVVLSSEALSLFGRKGRESLCSWISGRKYLTLLAVVAILQDVFANNGDWEAVFKRSVVSSK
jgi:hypothetical protein